VIDANDPSDVELRRLIQATDALRPSTGFGARMRDALAREGAPGFFELAFSSARRVVPLALLAALIATVYAVQSDHSDDDDLSTASSSLELE
jgi:hypothetical protein